MIGLGPNLFYNSPMEACVVICRTMKPKLRRKKVLFINAVNEVSRKNAESHLLHEHIVRIANAYHDFRDEENFSKVASLNDIASHGGDLRLHYYVTPSEGKQFVTRIRKTDVLGVAIDEWSASSSRIHHNLEESLNRIGSMNIGK